MKPKKELVRVVAMRRSGTVSIDFRGKAPGRGAYVCPQHGLPAKGARALKRWTAAWTA